ncbi:16S rRNA (uracil(1498)-N(3))-methyltransferase [Candidatus Peregrinibacteria bacterium]|jgi:16S rRNA (uracil1498-N3)-methyltransferase|nr:16S rRNA (uracil(1498)-N(3))-methyltransferase [Candidatus Peregrinibacteria bacterium]
MQRFFLNKECRQKNKIHIHDSAIVHQMNHVMRVKIDDEIICLFNNGEEHLSKVIAVSKKTVQLEILTSYPNKNELLDELVLIQALPKSKEIWERIIQKSVELGVSKIIPLKSSRVSSKFPSDSARIQSIIREAAEQSERGVLPELLESKNINKLPEYLKKDQPQLRVFLADSYKSKKSPLLLSFIINSSPLVKGSLGIIIGPEGGFTKEESEFLNKEGIDSLSLGASILRVETASTSSLAILAQNIHCNNL